MPPADRALADPSLDPPMLERAVRIAEAARLRGDHPFGAVLADESGAVVLAAGNTVETAADVTGHAETNLVRLASRTLTGAERAAMTLYTSTEPCAMCAGAIYWARIGAVVYALPEAQMVTLAGFDPRNPTMNLPCREVFARGIDPPIVRGPIETAGMREVHAGYWSPAASG